MTVPRKFVYKIAWILLHGLSVDTRKKTSYNTEESANN